MDTSRITQMPTFRSEKYRTPFDGERKLGLWVDRTGTKVDTTADFLGMRLLGMFAAVHVLAGSGRFVAGTRGQLKVAAGDTMLLFPDVPHHYGPDKAWQTSWVVWNGPEAGVLESVGYVSVNEPVIRDTVGAVKRAYDELEPVMTREDLAAALYRKQILLRMLLDLYTCRSGARPGKAAEHMREAMAFIESNCSDHLTVDALAKRFHLSVPHFRRLFKQYTGRSPSRYITSTRISLAKRLLADGRSIKETAFETGYDDVFYFMRVFKRETGMPPGRFTRELHAG